MAARFLTMKVQMVLTMTVLAAQTNYNIIREQAKLAGEKTGQKE